VEESGGAQILAAPAAPHSKRSKLGRLSTAG
jgi:hypothetical protein